MRNSRQIIGAATIAAIAVCALAGFFEAAKLKAFASRQLHAVFDPHKDEIPQPFVVSDGNAIPTKQSTYCWGNRGCADYAGGYDTSLNATAAVVKAGAPIDVSFAYKPIPAKVEVTQYFENRAGSGVPLTGGRYHAPTEPGLYYYGISAYWTSADGKYSAGDTSVVYAIRVQ
ncbi:hypothetical protein GZH47_09325 [Paenibacillus rhizovicinus]|uniref:Uncharacterized protein n=1 Tax=Paenibacillus rhizovicinus TaxID=2704463 RepID=A0A6C0NYL5_9BACL|nr:hypothetical protein [Paenibacillus rhizovicinus]QHW31036.1 hypothetical protein GZH47_09325 [Paenibacillus rhizovicinus]